MLLDQRLLESCGDAIAARSVLFFFLLCSAGLSNPTHAQPGADADRLIASFRREWPDLYTHLIGLERAHGVFYAALAPGKGKVNESDVFRLMSRRFTDSAWSARPDPEAEKVSAVLGTRGAEIIRRTHAFPSRGAGDLRGSPGI